MTKPPRILEIGEYPLMAEAYPDTTDHWSTQPSAMSRGQVVSLASLPRLARALASPDYDLVVVQPGGFHPWQLRGIARALFRRSALAGDVPLFRSFGQEMIRGPVRAPIAVWDMADAPIIPRHHVFLLDRSTLYFKRELPPDYWRVFTGTLHHQVPTPRFRLVPRQRGRIDKLRPIALGMPLALGRRLPALPDDGQKTADVFFAGRVEMSSMVRMRGLEELLALRSRGYRIDVPESPIPHDEFLQRCARAWVTWSPEGYGYETFRTYEASVCGSVAVINGPSTERYKPLRDGEHCFYYDAEPGELTRKLEHALSDRNRLVKMARAAREFVMAEHTYTALGRHVAETTLAHVRSGGST